MEVIGPERFSVVVLMMDKGFSYSRGRGPFFSYWSPGRRHFLLERYAASPPWLGNYSKKWVRTILKEECKALVEQHGL